MSSHVNEDFPDINNINQSLESGSTEYLTVIPVSPRKYFPRILGTLPQVPAKPQASLSHTFLRGHENTISSLNNKHVRRVPDKDHCFCRPSSFSNVLSDSDSMADRLGDNAENSKSPSPTRRDSQTAEKVSRACDNCKRDISFENLPIQPLVLLMYVLRFEVQVKMPPEAWDEDLRKLQIP